MFFTFDVKGDTAALLNCVIQIYGALLIGQGILVYTLRSHLFTASGHAAPLSRHLRVGVSTAYTVVFALSFAFVVRAQIMGVMNLAATSNSLLFLSMAAAYGLLAFRSSSSAPRRIAL